MKASSLQHDINYYYIMSYLNDADTFKEMTETYVKGR